MISVAEQFSSLRDTLGSVLGIFALVRWTRTLIAKITGRPPPADATSLTPAAFARFNGASINPDGSVGPPRPSPSKKPFFFFLLAAFGLPYLMGKMIRAMAAREDERLAAQGLVRGPDGQPIPAAQAAPIDPSQLDFCRVIYDYKPDTQGQPLQEGIDIEVAKGDLVAVLAKTDPAGMPSEWWRCRARDGRVGYLPGVYLEVIQRKTAPVPQIAEKAHSNSSFGGSRAGTMTSLSDRADTLVGKSPVPVPVGGKMVDTSADAFMKSQFYP
jgi:peroxin-13